MVKLRAFLLFFLLTCAFFSVVAQDRSIFIEGISGNAQHRNFFLENFRMEGSASGYDIIDSRDDAAYIFRFEVVRNMITFEDGSQEAAPPDEDQFLIQISLIDNTTNLEYVSFGFSYSDIDAMNEYTQFLFLRAALNIAGAQQQVVVVEVEAEAEEVDNSWRNKWLYLRVSADNPITFFQLTNRDILYLGTSVYDGDIKEPYDYTPTDNRTTALPAVTMGLQVQLHNWFSIEPIIQVILGDDARFLTMATGINLMVPLKMINNVEVIPYGAFSYPLIKSPNFSSFPLFAYGAGIQVGIKAGNMGILFLDVNFMNSFRNAVLKNPYGVKYPNPEGIHYSRRSIGLSLGYKFGFFDRRERITIEE